MALARRPVTRGCRPAGRFAVRAADIGRLAAATTAAGVHVDVRWQGERRPLPPDVELAVLLHGDFSAGPGPDGGFVVRARLPVPAKAMSA